MLALAIGLPVVILVLFVSVKWPAVLFGTGASVALLGVSWLVGSTLLTAFAH